jgi:hypothetical protein
MVLIGVCPVEVLSRGGEPVRAAKVHGAGMSAVRLTAVRV